MAKRKKNELAGEKVEIENPNFSKEETGDTNEIPNADMASGDNPLLGSPIVERDYAGAGAFDVEGDVIDSVEEPPQRKIRVDMNKDSNDAEEEETGDSYEEENDFEEEEETGDNYDEYQERKERQDDRQVDDDFQNLDSKTQNILSGNFANTMVDMYKMLLNVGGNFAKKSKEEYQSKAMQGKFDMRVLEFQVPSGDGRTERYGDFVSSYNDMIDEVMVLDKEKEKEMKELTKRIAKKRGVGMSDELTLGLLVGGDLIMKSTLLIQQYRMVSNVEAYVLKQYNQQQLGIATNMANINQNVRANKSKVENVESKKADTGTNVAEKSQENVEHIPVPPMDVFETKEKGE